MEYLSNRIFKSHDKDKYHEFAKDLYTHEVLSTEDITKLRDGYDMLKTNLLKIKMTVLNYKENNFK